MNEKKKVENKKADKKALKIFIPILIAAFFIGVASGVLIAFLEENAAASIANFFSKVLSAIAPYANLVMNGIAIVVCTILYVIAKKQIKAWDMESEEDYEKIDRKLSAILIISNVVYIISMFFFAVGFDYVIGVSGAVELTLYMLGFIISLAGNIIFQQLAVNATKLLNPEKQGSVYSFDFNKQWTQSCDEAELHKVYKAAYGSYKVSNGAYLVLWLVCIFGNKIWHFGLVPVAIVTFLWLLQFISYQGYAAYYEKHPEK